MELINLIEAFTKYVNKYDLKKQKIKLKYDHSFRVMELNKEMAIKLNFGDEDIYLAEIIGLLHDIGRFEQLHVYDTYDDSKSIDHADYSVEQLFDKNEIEIFDVDPKYYEIIKMSIKNHNKLYISDIDNERIMKHAKLIRDTDKIDILYNIAYLGEITLNDNSEKISDKVIMDIKKNRSVTTRDINNKNDFICCWMAFAFDINNDICLEKVKEYICVIYSKLKNKEIFDSVYNEVINYIEKRVGTC